MLIELLAHKDDGGEEAAPNGSPETDQSNAAVPAQPRCAGVSREGPAAATAAVAAAPVQQQQQAFAGMASGGAAGSSGVAAGPGLGPSGCSGAEGCLPVANSQPGSQAVSSFEGRHLDDGALSASTGGGGGGSCSSGGGSSASALSRASVELRLLPAPGCPDGLIRADLQVIHAEQLSSGAAAGPCTTGLIPATAEVATAAAASGSGPSNGAAVETGHGAADVLPDASSHHGGSSWARPNGNAMLEQQAQAQQQGEPEEPEEQQQPQPQQEGKKGKKGVKLKGRAASGAKDGKAPSRNKACPCGSKQKFKNCCGARRGGSTQQAGGEAAAAAEAAAVQLQTLYI